MTEAEPVYFRCDTTIFVKLQSHQDFDILDVSAYVGSQIAELVAELNKHHSNLPSGKMVLESGDITTETKSRCPQGRFKDD